MFPQEVLELWSKACESLNIEWYLYKETLLCVCGCNELRDDLQSANIVVKSKDLPVIFSSVLPRLSNALEVDLLSWITNKGVLTLKENEQIIISIDVLHEVENEKRLEEFLDDLSVVRRKANRQLKLLKLLNYSSFKVMDKLFWRIIRRVLETKRDQILALIEENYMPNGICFDGLTNKKPVLIDRLWLNEKSVMTCQGKQYPVFSGFHEYLTQEYGDYKQGLFDEIGCGLSADEKSELKLHQMRCKDALSYIQALSEKYQLRYYLIAGSVLGAVRHGGFIPWDDDIDIGVRLEDLKEFEDLVKQNLPEEYTLEQSAANHPYPRMFSKICYEGRCLIDIWPLIPSYETGIRALFTWYFAKIITKVHYKKIGQPVTKFKRIVRIMDFLFTDKQIMWMARFNERMYLDKETPAYINLYSIYRRSKELIKREWLDDKVMAIFDGIEVPIVGCTEQYLAHLYGDYMRKPAPWKRASRHVARFNTAELNRNCKR